MTPGLTKLLTEDPYEVPAKKGKGEKGKAKSLSSRHSSSEPSAEEGESERPSPKDGKRVASEEVEEVIPPRLFKRPRRAHIGSLSQTSAAVETIDSSSSERRSTQAHPRTTRILGSAWRPQGNDGF